MDRIAGKLPTDNSLMTREDHIESAQRQLFVVRELLARSNAQLNDGGLPFQGLELERMRRQITQLQENILAIGTVQIGDDIVAAGGEHAGTEA